MTSRYKAVMLFTCLGILTMSVEADSGDTLEVKYQDLNGDGINDLLSDSNGNGIPDAFDYSHITIDSRPLSIFAEFSIPIIDSKTKSSIVSIQNFLARQFSVRDLIFEQARCIGISGRDINNANQGSQGCIGGVCIGP